MQLRTQHSKNTTQHKTILRSTNYTIRYNTTQTHHNTLQLQYILKQHTYKRTHKYKHSYKNKHNHKDTYKHNTTQHDTHYSKTRYYTLCTQGKSVTILHNTVRQKCNTTQYKYKCQYKERRNS